MADSETSAPAQGSFGKESAALKAVFSALDGLDENQRHSVLKMAAEYFEIPGVSFASVAEKPSLPAPIHVREPKRSDLSLIQELHQMIDENLLQARLSEERNRREARWVIEQALSR